MAKERLPRGVAYHHVIFPKVLHRAQSPEKELRHNHWLKPPIDEVPHNELHRNVGMIAVPSFIMASRIHRGYEPVEGDYLASIDNLLFAITDTKNHYRTNVIERRILETMILGIDLQKPYIQEGLVTL